MDAILDCFFDKVFEELERGSLLARYKRRAMVQYLNTVIEGCIRGEQCDPQEASRKAVLSAVRYHERNRNTNGSICLMGKYHNILYVAAKLSFDWQMKDSATVACLLDGIFECEKSFERLLIGALFGTRAPHFIAGWKSDFDDREENVRAMVYFLSHSANACSDYDWEDQAGMRMVDVPLESCGKAPPARIALQLFQPDVLHILLRFGAIVPTDIRESGLEALLDRMLDFKRAYPYNMVSCLQLVLRVVPGIAFNEDIPKEAFFAKYQELVEDGILPLSRCGSHPAELRHLCKCKIRSTLWKNHQIPSGIRSLPIPDKLHKYLDLLTD